VITFFVSLIHYPPPADKYEETPQI